MGCLVCMLDISFYKYYKIFKKYMKMPFFKCIGCSQNEGNTRIKINSSCLSKPLIINLETNENIEDVLALEDLLRKIVSRNEKPASNVSPREDVV
jgi:hypothetical protein